MTGKPEKSNGDFALVLLIPNMLTIAAICAGLSAIRFGVQGNFQLAVQLIVAACLIDGLDGKIARAMGSNSKLGAELDSLGDFLNFGVAPPIILYFWALSDMPNAAWIVVLVYAVCCVLRLARFNVQSKADGDDRADPGTYFVGVPSPAGALLLLLPMFVSFAFGEKPLIPDLMICAHMIIVGLAMISRIPTLSFKNTRISRGNVKYFLVGFTIIGAALMTYAWMTLALFCLGYICLVIWSVLTVSPTDHSKGK